MLFLSTLLAGSAHAATLQVDGFTCGTPGIACTVAEALGIADAGDTIEVHPGSYTELILIDGDDLAEITIESTDGPSRTSLVDSPTLQVLITNGADVTIRGFAFNGGGVHQGIQVSDSTLTIEDNEFYFCHAAIAEFEPQEQQGLGGAVEAIRSDVTVIGNYFHGNTADFRGGAIGQLDGDLVVIDSFFDESAADPLLLGELLGGRLASGGAIYATVDTLTLQDSTFLGSVATAAGGAVDVDGANEVNFWNNLFQQNKALQFEAEDPFDYWDEIAEDELAGIVYTEGDGGGARVLADVVDVHQNVFCGNLGDNGGGLFLDDVPTATLTNNVFADNWAIHTGGGLSANAEEFAGIPTILNNTFVGNSAGKYPDPEVIIVYGSGGAISLDGNTADLRNNIIARQPFGGAIFGREGINWEIGERILFDYNLWYLNSDDLLDASDPFSLGSGANLTGDYAAQSLLATNLAAPPKLVYYAADSDCMPDAFYPRYDSAAVDGGDPDILDVGGSISDIGAYGGPGAKVEDEDADGFEDIYDCDDFEALVNPAANDVCDLQDNDCDGIIDNDHDIYWYQDTDSDGYGDADQFVPQLDCADLSATHSTNRDDCDDTDLFINPGANEICDGIDNDCNGTRDDDDLLVFQTWVLDEDSDGYGGTSGQRNSCADDLPGYALEGGDCDDDDPNINPGADEICDGLDNDCSTAIDDNPVDLDAVWYLDGDGDGVGRGDGFGQCDPPTGGDYTNAGGDCDDANPDVFPASTDGEGNPIPGAAELCDGIDNNCDGDVDGADALDAQTWYIDSDEDGIGDNKTAVVACETPGSAYTVNKGGDCDDENPDVGKCAECGCQATPQPLPTTLIAWVFALGLIRRRRLS
jgi:hypothetical protein